MKNNTAYILFIIQVASLASCVDYSSPEPIEITTPASVTTEVMNETPAFLIEIKSDQSVWYQILSKDSSGSVRIKEPIKENLKKAIGDFKNECVKKELRASYLIKGDNNTKFDQFEKIINALKENEIYKYNLVTSADEINQTIKSDDSSSPLDLMEPKEEKNTNLKYLNSETKLTLLLLKNNRIYGYSGINIKTGKLYDYKNIHSEIGKESKKYSDKFLVLIKKDQGASYQNTVDILDEMTINKIKRFAMLKMTDEEKEFVKKLNSITER